MHRLGIRRKYRNTACLSLALLYQFHYTVKCLAEGIVNGFCRLAFFFSFVETWMELNVDIRICIIILGKSSRYPVGVCKEVNLDQSFAGPQNFEHVFEFNPWGLDWAVILFASHATFSGSNVQREALRKIALQDLNGRRRFGCLLANQEHHKCLLDIFENRLEGCQGKILFNILPCKLADTWLQ